MSLFANTCKYCLVAGIIALSLITLAVMVWTMLL